MNSETPEEALKRSYTLANEGNYSGANQYISEDMKLAVKNSNKGISHKSLWDRSTKNGILERIEISSVEIRGEGAIVLATFIYMDGSSTGLEEIPLIFEKGRWKQAL